MSYTPLEQKLRTLILADSGLSALVGTNVYGADLPQGIMSGAAPFRAMTILRVSTQRGSLQERGIHSLALVRIQFTVWCKGSSSESDALSVLKALVDFLNNFDATSTNQFGSPATAPFHSPNFILNERITRWPKTLPPLYMGILDARIYNREDL